MRRGLAAAILALTLTGTAQAGRHDSYPLKPGSAGPRVCGLQWLLAGNPPSVWRSPRFTTFHGKPTCWWSTASSSRTTKAVHDAKYWLGYPLDQLAPDRTRAGRFFVQLLKGKVRRPASYIARAAARAHPAETAAFRPGYPLASRGTICGVPGVGTHSFVAPPNNWQSDRALDLCVHKGTPVLTVGRGTVCEACGYGYFVGAGSGRFAGQRLTLNLTSGDQVYYAHLETLAVPHYRGGLLLQGRHLGDSGTANGVDHLHIACRICNPYTLAR